MQMWMQVWGVAYRRGTVEYDRRLRRRLVFGSDSIHSYSIAIGEVDSHARRDLSSGN